MRNTDFMNLSLPEGADKIDVEILNSDFTAIENLLKQHAIIETMTLNGEGVIIGAIGPYIRLQNIDTVQVSIDIGNETFILASGENVIIRETAENIGIITSGNVHITYFVNPKIYADKEFYTKEKVDELLNKVEVEVDAELSETSENPVQNKVITAELASYATIAEVENVITPARYVDYTIDGYINNLGGISSETGKRTDYIPIRLGTKIKGYAKGLNGNLGIYGFFDVNKKPISVFFGTNEYANFEATAPDNAAFVMFSTLATEAFSESYAIVEWDAVGYTDKKAEMLKDVADYTKNIKLWDFTIKGYVNNLGGISSEAGIRTDYIPVKCGAIITGYARGLNGNLGIYGFFDSEYNPVSAYYGTNEYENYEVTVPSNVAYVVFSTFSAYKETRAEIKWNALNYADKKVEELKDKVGVETTFRVGFGNNDNEYNFASLYACFDKVAKANGKKVIHINSGTYDLLSEMGGIDYISSKENQSLSFTEVQPIMTDVTIKGWGKVVINFLLPERTVTDSPQLFSAINVKGNSCIENVEIHSCNCRYSIHDESGNKFPDTSSSYKNVRCYHNENGESLGQPQAIGCGYSDHQKVSLENCYLLSGNGEAWSCHANDGVEINFKNCVIKSMLSTSKALRISQNGQKAINAYIDSCHVDNGLSLRNEWTDTSITGVTNVTLINTKINGIYNGYSTVIEPVVSYNTIDGTETVLLDSNA